ncbi:MAG: DUF819 family protein [Rhodothermales bacterium]|nr:DUF819 family protein [Rhodothermales bacterium]
MPLISEPTTVFAFLIGTLAVLYWLNTLPALRSFFKILPPVIWAYFLPMIASTMGVIPSDSPTYSWIAKYLLPFSLFLLMMTTDLPSVVKLGRIAIIMMLAGTLGIVVGGPIAYAIMSGFLPPEAWKDLATLSGSWIGGTANMVAIQQSVGLQDLGPIIVVDTVVGYGWMGVLLFFGAFQERFDRWNLADRSILDGVLDRVNLAGTSTKSITLPSLSFILGLGFVATVISIRIGGVLPAVGNPSVISQTTWAVLVVVTVGIVLSFSPLQKLEEYGASKIGYLALYLLLTSIGARADVSAIAEAPQLMVAGAIWLTIHVAILLAAARIFRAPLFFVATGSMANIGGAASAPVVAGAYIPSMAPVGLLMGVAGYVLGIYAALFCAWILGQLSLIL